MKPAANSPFLERERERERINAVFRTDVMVVREYWSSYFEVTFQCWG